MSRAIQAGLVVLIVSLSVAYWVARFTLRSMPSERRAAWASRAFAWSRRAGLSIENARRVEAKLASNGACGSCESCRACEAPAATEAAGSSFKGIPVRRAH